ncbi:MAG: hypothetical protein WCE21_02815 [Candidatus Babeliales bacterium]
MNYKRMRLSIVLLVSIMHNARLQPHDTQKIIIESPLPPHAFSKPHKRPIITIWVHGSKIFFSKIMTRFSFSPPGISHAQDLDPKYHHRTIANTLSKACPALFPAEHFYLFGWSGKLDFQTRKKEALVLYEQIAQLVRATQQKYAVAPYVRIITHSHGGNVALNMALYCNKDSDFVIDELILLACPVQEETKNLVHAPCFKKVISLFSRIDSMQVMDPQGMYAHMRVQKDSKKVPLFSERVFDGGQRLMQASVQIGWRGLSHIEFLFDPFLTHLATIIAYLNQDDDTGLSVRKIILKR